MSREGQKVVQRTGAHPVQRQVGKAGGVLPEREGCVETSQQPPSNRKEPVGKLGKDSSSGSVVIGQGVKDMG